MVISNLILGTKIAHLVAKYRENIDDCNDEYVVINDDNDQENADDDNNDDNIDVVVDDESNDNEDME